MRSLEQYNHQSWFSVLFKRLLQIFVFQGRGVSLVRGDRKSGIQARDLDLPGLPGHQPASFFPLFPRSTVSQILAR